MAERSPGASTFLVAGAGPVGATLALALHRAGRAVDVIEPRPPRGFGAPAADPRSIALSWGSRLVLESAGLWSVLEGAGPAYAPAPVERLEVGQHGGLARTQLDAAELGLPALGYVVRYDALAAAADRALAAAGVPVRYGAAVLEAETAGREALARLDDGRTVPAAAVVFADGGREARSAEVVEIDRHAYAQHALVAEVIAPRLGPATASERFCAGGVIALLPRGRRHVLVWVGRPERIAALAAADPAAALREEFRGALGAVEPAGAATVLPLVRRVHRARPGSRIVPVGSAAQMLHPIGAQGLNLGLRDAYELARALHGAPSDDALPAVLARYQRRRAVDRALGVMATDFLARAAMLDVGPVRALRGAALLALDAFGPLRRTFFGGFVFGLRS